MIDHPLQFRVVIADCCDLVADYAEVMAIILKVTDMPENEAKMAFNRLLLSTTVKPEPIINECEQVGHIELVTDID